ncbi:uncharacterized protein BXZ73DRAFT_76573 [Epithele typhae]|uniref:uncharacterized protein n=1 Tax=Epithele typhae TaxID=378194 RepID=UPI0020084C7A|nr:uncharacterized protein BXZ73DRAFT_76573 [Epithele typhae]KAH9936750.1 hypothetical protein BXZ73DRAFT_76573 [Epithele typhae]
MVKATVRAFKSTVAKASGVVLDWIAIAAFAQQQFKLRAIYDIDRDPGQQSGEGNFDHQYSAAFCDGGDFLPTSFMSNAHVRGNLSLFVPDIEATLARGLPYILGETNSVACHGAPGVSNTAGAALWAADYTLQAAMLSIADVFYHEGIGYKYGNARVVELDVGDNNVACYVAYEHGRLFRAVFVKLHAWLASSTGARPSVHIDLGFARGVGAAGNAFWHGGGKARAKQLVIGHVDDTEGLTWAGQSYEDSGDVSPTGRMINKEVVLNKGLDLRSTEAVLLF